MDASPFINKPKTRKGRETLNRIVSAAAQVFYEKGYHSASINDITRLAGVASGTFYVYFDGKYNLYKFLLLQCSHMIRKHLYESTKNCKTRREMEEVGLREWLRFVDRNKYMYHVIWESLYIDKQLFVEYYENFAKNYIKGMEEAKANGEIAQDIDLEVVAFTLMGASNFLGLNYGLFKEGRSDSEEVVQRFTKIMHGGLFTGKAEKKEMEDLPIRLTVEFDDEEEEEEV